MAGTATKLGDHIPLTTRGDLALQICGTSRAGQIVRLKSRKCSIGSGELCTLRVRARSVKPLHCVIFRGQADTFVRCWAPDTRLNGQSFSDARLSPGDRIGVGPVEFEVLDPTDKRIHHGQTPDSRETTPAAKPPSADGNGTAGRDDLDRLTSRLVLANQQGRARVRRLLGQLRLAKTDLVRLEQGSTSPSTGDHSARPADGQERQSAAAQLMDQQQALEEERRQWEIARREAEQQLGGRAKELDEQMAQLEARQAALHRQRNEWEASRAEAEEQLVVRAAKVDKREAELDSRLAELRNASVATDIASSDSGSANTVSQDGAPLTNEQTEDASGEAIIADRRPSHHAVTDRPGASKPGPKPPIDVSTDDESVEQYMARLLGRVRGVARGQAADAKAETLESQPSVDSSGPVSGRPSREEHSEAEPDAKSAPADRSDTSDSSHQPSQSESDQDEDVAAARDLANVSAEEAIDRQMRSRLQSTATSRLLVTFLSIIGGTISTWGWLTGSDPFFALPGAIACFAVAAFSGVWYLLLIGNTPHLDLMSAERTSVPIREHEPDDSRPAEKASDDSSLGKMPANGEIYATIQDEPQQEAS